jgi:hypothetical protein
VTKYQKGVSIVVDGIVGPRTWYHLLKGDSIYATTPQAAPQKTQTAVLLPPASFTPAESPHIWEMTLEDKLLLVLKRVPHRLVIVAQRQGKALTQLGGDILRLNLSTGELETLALALAFVAGAIVLGGGVLLALGLIGLGLDATMHLATCLQIAVAATTEREITEAADELCAVLIEVGIAALTFAVGKLAQGLKGESTAVVDETEALASETPSSQETLSPAPAQQAPPPKALPEETPPEAPSSPREPIETAKPRIDQNKLNHIFNKEQHNLDSS